MKPSLTLLITLAITLPAQAQKSGFALPQVKVPSPVPGLRVPAASLPVRPNATAVPSAALRKAVSVPRAGASLSGSQKRPAVPAAIPGLGGSQGSALREGRRIAEGIRAAESLRGYMAGSQAYGDVFRQPGNPGRPDQRGVADPGSSEFDLDRKPKAPDHVSGRSRNGPRDLRNLRASSTRGSEADRSDATPTTRSVVDSASSMTFGTRGGGTASSDVQWHRDEATGEVAASQTGTDGHGRQTRLDVIEETDSSGRVTGTTETRTTAVGPKAVETTIVRDASGRVIYTTNSVSEPCDRTAGDVAVGGPVNGSGPSVGQAAGLMPLDLLRQHANGERPAGGGTNYSVTRDSGAAQVRPVGQTEQNGITTRRKPAAISGQGLEGGGNVPGGDLPD